MMNYKEESIQVRDANYFPLNFDDLVKSPNKRHPGESRGPELIEITGFRLPPE
jgi:hypothetical protein